MNKTNRISLIILGIIVAVTVILLVSLFTNLSDVDNDPKMGMWINSNLYWAYILFALAAGLAIIFALGQMVTDWKSAKGGLVGIGFILVVVLIAFLLSSGKIPQFPGVQKFIDDGTLTERVAKWVDTGLITTYLLLGIAILSLIGASVSRLFGR